MSSKKRSLSPIQLFKRLNGTMIYEGDAVIEINLIPLFASGVQLEAMECSRDSQED